MRDPRVVVAGKDGVPREVFGGDTARMNRDAQNRLTAACEAIPMEMVGGETTRIDATTLTSLIETSEGCAVGTPKNGLPVLPDDDVPDDVPIEVADVAVEAAPQIEEPIEEPVQAPVPAIIVGHSPMRNFLIGGVLAMITMLAWYCATQL
jgi:hypothetical protein